MRFPRWLIARYLRIPLCRYLLGDADQNEISTISRVEDGINLTSQSDTFADEPASDLFCFDQVGQDYAAPVDDFIADFPQYQPASAFENTLTDLSSKHVRTSVPGIA